jgi:murein L,D-transpeptidase YcbB/YkuD
MNKFLSEQSLNINILLETEGFLSKSFVTLAASAGLLLLPLAALAVAAEGEPAGVAFEMPAEDTALQVQIEQRLRERAAHADETTALFYLSRGYRPAWEEPSRVAALIAAVESAQIHGLDPRDFSLERLLRAADAAATLDLRAERELVLTDTLVELLFQLRHGKVDPRMLYREWNFTPPPNPYERAGELAAVLQAGDLRAAIEAHAPDLPLYRALVQGLAHYQALAMLGDWPKVPAGPTLRPGERSVRVPALRARLLSEPPSELPSGVAEASRSVSPGHYDPVLVEAVKRFQARHGLEPDGIIGAQTLLALNTSPARRVEQIRANLERLRWVAAALHGDRLLVDIVGYHADLVLDGQPVWESKVIVGKPARKTPSLRDSVVNLVFNPKWVVPPTILREDVIPRTARNLEYLASHRLRIVDRSGQTVDPSIIDWAGARQSGFPYTVVQQSGADGSLGRIKFSLSNPYAIYLHDTNARSLFRRAERALSSGCVRVEKPAELARLLLADPSQWSAHALDAALDSGRTRTVRVGREVTVLLHYSTAALDESGQLQLRNDIYDYDRGILEALAARRSALPR